MLTTTITCLSDQTVAERMRVIARRMQCDYALTEQAADEAVRTYQVTDSIAEGLNAGLAVIQSARAGQPPERADDRADIVRGDLFRVDRVTNFVLWTCAAVLAALIAWGIAA